MHKETWGLALLGLIVLMGSGQPLTPEDTGAFQTFIALLEPCLEITVVISYEKCTFPAGNYCLFYTNDPTIPPEPGSYHSFGWYSEEVGCGALYTLVRGRHYDRCDPTKFLPGPDPWAVLPCEGWGLVIPEAFKKIGFWLNNPNPPTGVHSDAAGHYFTCSSRNWDGLPHAFICEAAYKWKEICEVPGGGPIKCGCDCCVPAPKGLMYLIFWEDWCKGEDWDWNDFMVALIPCRVLLP